MERKKIARRQRVPQAQASEPNQCWSADFVSDKLTDGRTIRIVTVIDQFTCECVWLEAGRSMNGPKVVAALTQAITERGARPRSMTLDYGSEFAGRAMEAWAIQAGVQLCFIRPGRPWRMASSKASTGGCGMNASTSNGSRRFEEARRGLALWRDHYNHRRPHSALDDRSPAVFAGLHGIQEKRFALFDTNQTNGKPRQGFASPAEAALDPARRLPEDIQYQGEALLRIAHTRDSLLSRWSDFQAHKTGSGGP